MKIAFPVLEDKGLDSVVHGHFGSAPFFVFVDVDGDSVEVFENPDQDHQHGNCNPMSALGGRRVDGVVVGGIGGGALKKLKKRLSTSKLAVAAGLGALLWLVEVASPPVAPEAAADGVKVMACRLPGIG